MPSYDQLMRNFRWRCRFTYILRIPISTTVSRPHICNAFGKLENDPLAVNIPEDAYLYPEQLSINLGTLSLDNIPRLNAALALLNKVNLHKMAEQSTSSEDCTPSN